MKKDRIKETQTVIIIIIWPKDIISTKMITVCWKIVGIMKKRTSLTKTADLKTFFTFFYVVGNICDIVSCLKMITVP